MTAGVFKKLAPCFGCDDQFYFSPRAIPESHDLICPACKSRIDLGDSRFESLRLEVSATLAEIVSP
jgi:hypothetical protein